LAPRVPRPDKWKRYVHRHDPLDAEAGIDLERLHQAAPEEAGADQQHERDRDLRNYYHPPGALTPPRTRRAASTLDEALARIAGGRAGGGERAEAGGHGRREQEREQEHGDADGDALEAWEGRRGERDQAPDAADGEQDAEHSSREREHERLGQELPD